MFESGLQCDSVTLDETDFCEAHQRVVFFERHQEPVWQRLLLRIVALLLLLIFLIPIVYTVRELYLGPPVRTQEAW